MIRFIKSTDCADENSQDLETPRKSSGITLTRAGPYRLRDFGKALDAKRRDLSFVRFYAMILTGRSYISSYLSRATGESMCACCC